MKKDYVYNAIVKSVYDGDTIRVDIDLGFNIWMKNESIRLYGIDTPEIHGTERFEGLKAKEWLSLQIPVGTKITIQTRADGKEKYGRWLGTIFVDQRNLNEELVTLGYAKEFMT